MAKLNSSLTARSPGWVALDAVMEIIERDGIRSFLAGDTEWMH